MFSRSKFLIIILVLILIVLSACGSEQEVSPVDTGGDGEQKVLDPSDTDEATIHYHYLVKHPDAEWTIEPIIPVEVTPGKNPGSFIVSGISQVNVQYSMGADKETERCKWHCNIDLIFTTEGEITLDENTGKCIIPMKITFTPEQDQWIMESNCPSELEAWLNCSTQSVHLLDPSVYTFEANKRNPKIPTEDGVTLWAELKNFTMPSELDGLCDW